MGVTAFGQSDANGSHEMPPCFVFYVLWLRSASGQDPNHGWKEIPGLPSLSTKIEAISHSVAQYVS